MVALYYLCLISSISHRFFNSLVKFIPKYFILYDAIVNEIVSLISLLGELVFLLLYVGEHRCLHTEFYNLYLILKWLIRTKIKQKWNTFSCFFCYLRIHHKEKKYSMRKKWLQGNIPRELDWKAVDNTLGLWTLFSPLHFKNLWKSS